MLLEYKLDTKEEDIQPRSIELRKRFANRRISEAIEKGIVRANDLIRFKELNKEERLIHQHDVHTIVNSNIAGRVAVARAEQQLLIQGNLRALDVDVSRATRLSKSRLDTLEDLERRIHLLRNQLKQSNITQTVDGVIDTELKINNTTEIGKKFTQCNRCKRKIISELFFTHSNVCQKLENNENDSRPPVYDINASPIISLATFPPQPPRKCKFLLKGCNFIQFEWEPPIIDGGLPVYDYEIRYKRVYVHFDNSIKAWRRTIKDQPNLLTSSWVIKNPICHTGYKLVGLTAATEYLDWEIRCCNLQGFSEWTSLTETPGEGIVTDPPKPPSQPLFFTVDKITSSCLHLSWTTPLFNGGVDITDYIITYSLVRKEKTVTKAFRLNEQSYTVHVGSPDTKFVIRNLPSRTEIAKVAIYAITLPNVRSIDSKLHSEEGLCTATPSRYRLLVEQINAAKSSTDDFLDTDFETGILQRLNKKQFLKRLQSELSKTPVDPLEEEESQIWEKIKADKIKVELEEEAALTIIPKYFDDEKEDEEKDTDIDTDNFFDGHNGNETPLEKSFKFTHRARERHFRHKLLKLEELIKSLRAESYNIEANRTHLTMLMNRQQKKKMDLQSETDRVKNFKGDSITSSVLHGADMRYDLESFTVDLQVAFEDCLATIATSKKELIEGETRKKEIKKELEIRESQLKLRIAAFAHFNFEKDKAIKAIQRIKGSNTQIMSRIFSKLKEITHYQRSTRALVLSLFNDRNKKFLKAAYYKWHLGFFERDSKDTSSFLGTGSVFLQKVKDDRELVQAELRDLLAENSMLQSSLKTTSYTHSQRQKILHSSYYLAMEENWDPFLIKSRGMSYLIEADSFAQANKFELALRLYEAQIITLRSTKEKDVKMLAICYGRLGKLFLRQERYDRAILEFDRQMSLAKEIDDKVEEAEAFFGMGTGYLFRCNYPEALRYLQIAQIRMEILGHIPKSCDALRGLRECYTRTHRPDLVELYNNRITEIEKEMSNKTVTIRNKLLELKEKLVNTTAEIELCVKLERVTYHTIELRELITARRTAMKEKEEELENQREAVIKMSKLMDDIQKELTQALDTDEEKMISYLVHDQPQEVEIEELKSRLNTRKKVELKNYQEEYSKQQKIETTIKNLMDEIGEAEDDLKLEGGELMSAIRNNRPFRCIAFNPANAAGNEVTGTATGGVENFIAAESSNIHLFDIHSGELMHIWVGDDSTVVGEKKGHVAVVTCLAYDILRVYSGSADETIMVWDTTTMQRVMVLEGHEGTIVTMAIDGPYLFSGSADATIRMWDKESGRLFRILTGHSHSVLSMEVGPTWLITGSADEEVRVWTITRKSERYVTVETAMRLVGHEVPVTCVRYGKLEVISGDSIGRIFVWWMETGEILRQCTVHKGPVRCLQFDATRIVSGGMDSLVCITDIGSGEVLQSLRGHTSAVLAVAFDTERIISASIDNTLRYWEWGKKSGPQDKYHVLDRGQTLVDLSKIYKIPVADIMSWNGINDLRQCYSGMKLIVGKGDPSKLTTAEEAAAERERRLDVGLSYAKKKTQNISLGNATVPKYDRVHRMVTDVEESTLGNRMFKTMKTDTELFPDTIDKSKDIFSLASRLASAGNPLNNTANKIKISYYISGENEEEWGPVADSLGIAMIDVYVEFIAYEIAKDEISLLADKHTFSGRLKAFNNSNTENSDLDKKKKKIRKKRSSVKFADDPFIDTSTTPLKLNTINEIQESELNV